jgi:hypothetical protein
VPRVPAVQSVGRDDNIQLPIVAGSTWKTSALVFLDGTPELNECGADPAVVYGVTEEPAGKNPVDATKGLVCRATEAARWWFPCSADPVAANIGIGYGAAKDADGIWYVDFTDAVNVVFYVHQIDVDTKRAEVSIVEAVRQAAP